MPAARDVDWQHVHVLGDKAVAARYLPFARKLLGFVKQDAGFNKLGVRKEVRRFDDGTVVIAELIGSIPRITIQTVPQGGQPPSLPWADYAMQLGDAYRLHDAMLLNVEKNGGYKARLWSKDSLGFGAPAGIYKGAYPSVQKNTGLHFVCGEIWHENADGECVSWPGHAKSRYWYIPYRAPCNQGRGTVFHQGGMLLDMGAYGLEYHNADMSEYFVRAAALRKGWLYCVLSPMGRGISYADPPKNPTHPGETWAAPLYENRNADIYLVRFPLRIEHDVHTRRPKYAISARLEVLWHDKLYNGDGPWVFSKDLSVCTTVSRPTETRVCYNGSEWASWNGSAEPDILYNGIEMTPFDGLHIVPTDDSNIYRLKINFDAPKPQVEYESEAAAGVIIEDSGYQVRLVKVDGDLGIGDGVHFGTVSTNDNDGTGYDIVMRGRSYQLARFRVNAGDNPGLNGQRTIISQITHCDPVNDVLVLARTKDERIGSVFDVVGRTTSSVVFYRGGQRVVLSESAAEKSFGDYPIFDEGDYAYILGARMQRYADVDFPGGYVPTRGVFNLIPEGLAVVYASVTYTSECLDFHPYAATIVTGQLPSGVWTDHAHLANFERGRVQHVTPALLFPLPGNADWGHAAISESFFTDDPRTGQWTKIYFTAVDTRTSIVDMSAPTAPSVLQKGFSLDWGGCLSDAKRSIYTGYEVFDSVTVANVPMTHRVVYATDGDLKNAAGSFLQTHLYSVIDGVLTPPLIPPDSLNFVKLGKPPLFAEQTPQPV